MRIGLTSRLLSLMGLGIVLASLVAEPVLAQRRRFGFSGLPSFWISDDLGRGFREARESGQPLLLVFRCPP